MVPYFLLIGFPLLYQVLSFHKKEESQRKKTQNIIFILFFVGWLLLLMLRDDSVGIDIRGSYLPYFRRTAKMSWTELFQSYNSEYGYWILNKLISYITTDEQVFLAIIALITVIPLFYLYIKESKNAILTISLFNIMFFDMYFSGLRQCIAMAFAVPAYYFVRGKKFFKFALMVCFAALFHKSAWILIAFYPVYHSKMNTKRLSILLILFIFVFIFKTQLFNFLISILGGEYEKEYNIISDTGAYPLFTLICIFCVYAFMVPQDSKMDKDIIGLRNILFLSAFLQCFTLVNYWAMRMNYYFLMFLPILISKIPGCCKEQDKGIIQFSVFIMIFVFLVYFFVDDYTGINRLNIFPYVPFWRG